MPILRVCEQCGANIPACSVYIDQNRTLCRACWEHLHIRRCCGCSRRGLIDQLLQGIDQDWYCSDCYHERFFTCQSCGQEFEFDQLLHDPDGDLLCEACWSENFFVCGVCGEVCSLEDEGSITITPDGGVCERCAPDEPQELLQPLADDLRQPTSHNTPPSSSNSGNQFGPSNALEEHFFNSCAANDNPTMG